MGIKQNNTITHIGLVLNTFNRTYDCGYELQTWALVWNPITLLPEEVYIGYDDSALERVTIDATEDNRLAYNGCLAHKRMTLGYNIYDLKKDMLVRVVCGRKVPLNTIGYIQAVYKEPFDTVYIKDNNNKQWKTYARNIEVIALPISERPDINFKALAYYRKLLHNKKFNNVLDNEVLK